MTDKTKKTAPSVSVGADTEQSSENSSVDIINNDTDYFNSYEEISGDMFWLQDESFLKTVSMSELYDTVFQSKPPIIEGLLYPGTYIFAGAPKLGKSFLMAQLAYHISTGTPLWNYTTRKGTVLYLALEDDYRRLQERLYRMFGTDCVDDLYFSVKAEHLGKGLDEQLNKFITDHPRTNLIIIDTLQKIRETSGDSYSYSNDYDVISRIKAFTDSKGICILLVHHTRKQSADDKFDMISGTTGLLGAADGGFVLQKEKRTANNAVLEISGRDQPDQKLYLIRNTNTLLWELDRAETELWKAPAEPLLEIIASFINADNPKWCGTPTELVSALQIDAKPNAISKKLNVNAGRMFNEYGIIYDNKRTHEGRRITLKLITA